MTPQPTLTPKFTTLFLAALLLATGSQSLVAALVPLNGERSWISASGVTNQYASGGSLSTGNLDGGRFFFPLATAFGGGSAGADTLTVFADSFDSFAGVNAAKVDTFTLHGAIGTTVTYTAFLTVDGTINITAPFPTVSRGVIGAAIGGYTQGGIVSNAFGFPAVDERSFTVNSGNGLQAPINANVHFTVFQTGVMQIGTEFDLGFQLRGDLFNTGSLDATAVISFILPENVTITSRDGFGVTAPHSVPDGGSAWVNLTVLVGCLALGRRFRLGS